MKSSDLLIFKEESYSKNNVLIKTKKLSIQILIALTW